MEQEEGKCKMVSQVESWCLLANEAENSLLKCRRVQSKLKNDSSGLICKFDIEKAYDHVNWTFFIAFFKR